MRDTYQNIFAKYPTLTSFSTVAGDEISMIATLKKLYAKYRLSAPTDAQVFAANTTAATVTSISNTDGVAINLEQSTATLMTRLSQTTDNRDVANVIALIKTASLGSHATAFTAEQTTVATPPTTPITPPATPAQVVALKTPLVPPPSIRPFPAPVTTCTVTVPASIDATGSSDVGAALNAFVATVPDGSIIAFPTGATYRLDKGIQIANRHNLVFAGNGATLKVGASASGNDQLASSFALGHQYGGYWANGNTDIVIHDFILIGNDPTPGTFTGGQEGQANLEITGTDRVEIYGITGSAAPGDFAFITGVHGAWIHDCNALTAGRNGVSVIAGSDILVEACTLGVSGYCTFDIEPNGTSDACSNITFRNCTAKTWGLVFLSVEGSHTGAMIDGITVFGNAVTGNSLLTNIDNGGAARMTRITFTNNKGGKAAAGSVLRFAHVDGLTVTGNIQPLSSGVLGNITDSTGVVTS